MTTSRLIANRGQETGAFDLTADGALTQDVRVIADSALSKQEVLIEIGRVEQRLLQIDVPRL